MPLFVELARPCPLDLSEIVPEGAPRFHCRHCDREVHVLSNMSEAEARRMLDGPGQPCVAYLREHDGRVRFREPDPFVPVERLAGPRRLLGAGALLLSVAACAPHEDERVEAVDLATFTPDEVPLPPPRWAGGKRKRSWTGGTPTARKEVERGEFVDSEELEAQMISKPLLDSARFTEARAARRGQRATVTLDYCVDTRGRVVDAERIHGDEELAAILLDAVRRWRFKPFRRDGRRVRVCTRQHFRFILE